MKTYKDDRRLVGKKVLVVEDSDHMRAYISKVLAYGGATIIEAENGEDAVEAIKKERVDLVLMDISMPTMGGIEASRRIKKSGGGPILMASSNHTLLERAATAGLPLP